MYTFFRLPGSSSVARSASSAYSIARDLRLFRSQDLMLLLLRRRRRRRRLQRDLERKDTAMASAP